VKPIFVDTLYWGALLQPRDQYHSQAIHTRRTLGEVLPVTTDEVLIELLNGLSLGGPFLREAATHAVRRILDDEHVKVHPQSRASFLAGLRLYEMRSDKGYSLVDCISMTTMLREEITEVLTNDRHFVQEGYRALLR
jgi:predicted nucleic acid-binding protein